MSKHIIDNKYSLASCECGCHFLYEENDTRFRGSMVECPKCGKQLPAEGKEANFWIATSFLRSISNATKGGESEFICTNVSCGSCPFLDKECDEEMSLKELQDEFRKWQEAGESHA